MTGFICKSASRAPKEEGGFVLGCTQSSSSAPVLGSLQDAAMLGAAGGGKTQPDMESNGFYSKWGLGREGGGEGECSMPQGACFSDLRYLNYRF